MVEVADRLHGGGVLAVEGVGHVAGAVEGDAAFVERNVDRSGGQLVEVVDELHARLGGGVEPVPLVDLFGDVFGYRSVEFARPAVDDQL